MANQQIYIVLQLVFVDFQGLQPAHISRDIWYYIYNSTDSEWRRKYLNDSLRHYFEELSPYLERIGKTITFEDFLVSHHIKIFP